MTDLKLLDKVIQLRNGIVRYAENVQQSPREANDFREESLRLYGEIGQDLVNLEIPMMWEGSGRSFPIFETALQGGRHGPVHHESVQFALSSLDTAIGILRRRIAERPSGRLTAWARLLGYPLSFAAGWAAARYYEQARLVLGVQWQNFVTSSGWGKAVTIALTFGGILFGGLMTNEIHQSGWVGRRQVLYFVLTFAMVAILILR